MSIRAMRPSERIGRESYTKLAFEEVALAHEECREPEQWAIKECATEEYKMRRLSEPCQDTLAFIPRRRMRRPKISRRKRSRVFQAANGYCHYCRVELAATTFHVDHVVPVSAGGSNADDNLVASCAPCNLKKGARQ